MSARRWYAPGLWFACVLGFSGSIPTARVSAECLNTCGDMNSSGTVTSADVITLFHYVGFIRPNDNTGFRDCGELDEHLGVNARDYERLLNYVFNFGPSFDCMPDSSPYVPVANSDVRLRFNNVFPRGMDSTRVWIVLATE